MIGEKRQHRGGNGIKIMAAKNIEISALSGEKHHQHGMA
jgi:hypothetical protein